MKKKDLTRLIYTGTTKQLLKYLQEEYNFFKERDVSYFKNKVSLVKKLDMDTINFGISRMEKIQAEKELNSSVSGIVALVLAIITSYGVIFKDGPFMIGEILSAVLLIGFFLYFCFLEGDSRKHKSNAVFYKSLLLSCKELKKEEK
jgi:predicted PurR-regulated permease PerM